MTLIDSDEAWRTENLRTSQGLGHVGPEPKYRQPPSPGKARDEESFGAHARQWLDGISSSCWNTLRSVRVQRTISGRLTATSAGDAEESSRPGTTTSPRTSSHFPRALSNAAHNLSRITCMGHWAGITSVKEKYKNRPGSDARCFSLDGWSQCTRSRCTESISAQQIDYPPCLPRRSRCPPRFVCRLCSLPPDNIPARIQKDWGKDEVLLRAWG